MDMLKTWKRLSKLPRGKQIFSKLVCWQVPYFKSIHPTFISLTEHYCQVEVIKHRAIENHLKTIHAIVMCNMAELAGGALLQASLPKTHRFIPKEMQVKYLKKAKTNLVAKATHPNPLKISEQSFEHPIWVEVHDLNGDLVFTANINMWIGLKSD